MIIKINDTIAKLRNSGLYDSGQISAIEYVLYTPGINADILINANIPSKFMIIYAFLMQNDIPVEKYSDNWYICAVYVDGVFNKLSYWLVSVKEHRRSVVMFVIIIRN